MKTVYVDGLKLRMRLHEQGVRMRELAQRIGVTHYQVSRWARRGIHAVRVENAQALAEALHTQMDTLLATDGLRQGANTDLPGLSADESEILFVLRSLTPLQRARARIKLQEIVDEAERAASADGPHRD
jgi:transcriptional regulator with XRE-family HTH domain